MRLTLTGVNQPGHTDGNGSSMTHPPSETAAAAGSSAGGAIPLRRSLTLAHAVLYGLGVVIGAGIYVLIAAAAARAGYHAPVAFIITAILIGLTGASLAELAVRMPVAAGEAAYVRAGFQSDWAAAMVGYLVIAIAIVTSATISVGAAGYIGIFIAAPERVIITGVVISMGLVAARGIVESVTFASLMTLIETGGLIAIIIAGFLFEPQVVTRAPEMLPATLDPEVWSGIGGAALLAVFAFIGFEGIVNIAEEVKDPTRNLPRAIFITLALATVLYVLVMWIALAALGVDTLAASKAPLALVFERLTGASPKTMSAIAVVATLNGIVVSIIMGSRVTYGLAKQGSLPAWLGQVNATTQTPLIATLLLSMVILAFALFLPIAELADLSARLTLAMFAIVNLALYLLKAREEAPPAGALVFPKWVPLAGFVSCVGFMLADIVSWLS